MPPFVGRKRLRSASPPETTKTPSLFETADKPTVSTSVQDNKAFLDSLEGSDSDSSLSDVSSSEFEDVSLQPASKKPRIEIEDDEEVDWEDAIPEKSSHRPEPGPQRPLGDLELTLDKGAQTRSLTDPHQTKKGPSKIERQIRVTTHCMHVQFLLFHNLVRNGWACDKHVHAALAGQLPPQVQREIDKWKVASGMDTKVPEAKKTASGAMRNRKKGKATDDPRSQREWGKPAARQEKGAPNMSSGDPILRLLRILAAYWKKRFTITAPNLRKEGYKTLAQLEEEIASFRNDKHNHEVHGERVRGVEDFRKMAKTCEGSRDVGVQLFTALIRSLGLEARLVASLQPVGFGWSKNEDVSPKKKSKITVEAAENDQVLSSDDGIIETSKPKISGGKRGNRRKGKREAPIDLSEENASENDNDNDSDDDESVIDITPSMPKRKPNQNYDRDMAFPTYWTEVISPITNEVYPVDPFIVSPPVATKPEHLSSFEPRGAKADKAKLVLAYVVAYSSDGSAKDVTTRYLKRHMWPGRTKGVRMPVEKIPIYNKHGKIKHREDYDWFKTVMSGYRRPDHQRTAVDDLEGAKDLKPAKPEKKESKGEESLQGYKSSADFVLERHLRREEALRPGSQPVKQFSSGKGDKAKSEPVFLRKDVLVCRTGESWHKEGRQVKGSEHPIKLVPVRAVTLTRKREVEEAEREGGEKLKQGLYSWDQTEWIIPPPIQNGIIPKNAFGNMDVYVPSMVPEGAVHIPLRSTMKICKRLGIDYAEAVTGFEFGNKRAVPVITGVVVAAEHEDLVIDEWEKDEEERKRKEEGKREKLALNMWKKFLTGLRIMERVKDEYGGDADAHLREEMNPFTNQNKVRKGRKKEDANGLMNGEPSNSVDDNLGGGFMPDDGDVAGGGFLHDDQEAVDAGSTTPHPLDKALQDRALSAEVSASLPTQSSDLIIEETASRNRFISTNLPEQSTKTSSPEANGYAEPMDIDSKPMAKKRGRPPTRAKKLKTPPNDSAEAHRSSEGEESSTAKKKRGKRKADSSGKRRTPKEKHMSDGVDERAENSLQSKAKQPTRRAPTRRATRKSAAAVRSPYFEGDESENVDEGRSEEEEGEKIKSSRRTRTTR
ncbi:MAG: hypothetical protein Q9191_001966, partial [Dirinaria sp. TL-2023a]